MTRFLTSCLLIAVYSAALAQAPGSQGEPQVGFTITKLPPAVYPPIALAAHVSGDVVLKIALRPNGAIDSVEVVSGPPMLRQAAVENFKQAQFECVTCNGQNSAFQLIYRFELGPSITCDSPDNSYPRASHSENIVTIAAQPFGTCDPAATFDRIHVRSARCLFLWKCGWR
jgi:TonB family protein